jgi:hypothetical protein
MWTVAALLACTNPAPPDALHDLRRWATARCALEANASCRAHGAACYPDAPVSAADCEAFELYRWSGCAETDLPTVDFSACIAYLRSFDCDAPCDGAAYAFDTGPCAPVIAARAGCE